MVFRVKPNFNEKEVLEDMTSLLKIMQVVRIRMNENGTEEMFD